MSTAPDDLTTILACPPEVLALIAEARRAVSRFEERARGTLEAVTVAVQAFDIHVAEVGRELDNYGLDFNTREALEDALFVATPALSLDAELDRLIDLIEDARESRGAR
jgi:hypothetical protein